MAIRIQYTKRFNGVHWKSGHFYKFKYSAWANDPEPVILLMYSFSGIHPTTGHEWRFIQGINFTYLPRTQRKSFVNSWMREWERNNGNFQVTWNRLSAEYPMVKDAVRRYFYKPSYYISKSMEIPMEDIENVVVGTWSKDFSKKVRTSLAKKMKRVKDNIKRGFRR